MSDFTPIIVMPFRHPITNESREIRRFQSERFVFCIETPEHGKRKVLQTIFGKDGSLYVTLPYFEFQEGILSIGTIPPGMETRKIDLKEKGRVTAHAVKYAHHPDGEIHFHLKQPKASGGPTARPFSPTRGGGFLELE